MYILLYIYVFYVSDYSFLVCLSMFIIKETQITKQILLQ